MQCSDVALWLTPFSCWPDYVAFVCADTAFWAAVQLMGTHDLQHVYKAAVTANDGTSRRWGDMESSMSEVGCEPA